MEAPQERVVNKFRIVIKVLNLHLHLSGQLIIKDTLLQVSKMLNCCSVTKNVEICLVLLHLWRNSLEIAQAETYHSNYWIAQTYSWICWKQINVRIQNFVLNVESYFSHDGIGQTFTANQCTYVLRIWRHCIAFMALPKHAAWSGTGRSMYYNILDPTFQVNLQLFDYLLCIKKKMYCLIIYLSPKSQF